MQADYVIVGAGSAGCVLANRLTEDPATSVILIEAGGRDYNPLIHVPAGFFKMLDHDTLTWKYRSEPDPGTNGRVINYTRGKVIGGSSSIKCTRGEVSERSNSTDSMLITLNLIVSGSMNPDSSAPALMTSGSVASSLAGVGSSLIRRPA